MGKSGGQAEAAAARRHGPNGPDVVTAGATLGGGGSAGVPSVRERLRSHDLAVKVFVAGATYVALSWVNQGWAVVGAVLSPVVSDLIRDYVERHHWSLRRLRRGAAATVLLGHEEDAYAARRRARAGWRSRAPISLVAGAATVTAVVSAVALAGVGEAAPPDRRHGSQPPPVDHVPAQVAGVHGTSPTTKPPVIEWGTVQGAHRYIVFRNGHRVGVRTGRRFVDRTATHGVLTYTVAAEAGGRTGQPSTGRTIVYQAATAPSAGLELHGATHTTQPPSFHWDSAHAAHRYVIYRDGARIDEIRGTAYIDPVGPGTYTYAVAWLRSGVESRPSDPLTIVYALGDTKGPSGQPGSGPPPPPPPPPQLPEKPVLPTGYVFTNAPPRFKWGVVKYATSFAVYRDSTRMTTLNHSFIESSPLPDGTYTYRVSGVNSQGHEGPKSDPLVFVLDTAPPVTPARVRFTGSGTIGPPTMTWHAVADAVGGYIVLREGRTSVPVSGTTYSDTDAPIGVVSRYQVEAVDQAGNVSAPSTTIEITRTG